MRRRLRRALHSDWFAVAWLPLWLVAVLASEHVNVIVIAALTFVLLVTMVQTAMLRRELRGERQYSSQLLALASQRRAEIEKLRQEIDRLRYRVTKLLREHESEQR